MSNFNKLLIVGLALCLNSCGAYFNQPLFQEASRTGEYSASTQDLLDLPEPAGKVEVAVYNFGDQTGQFKAVENGSTFSTAVTQGGTTILIKALEDCGYFVPIERENLSNLTTERQIIKNTKEEYLKNQNLNEPPLPPLLFAGLILEGGIVSYDTNIVTGGLGARYFGLGASSRYRQDRVTVYLRAVSTKNGEILKTVYVSKTILSQSLNANFFRFVKFQRLLEAETGITQNEPVQLAVKDAIEKAVRDLVVEGVKDGYWSTRGGAETNNELVQSYLEEKALDESTGLYNRLYQEPHLGLSLEVAGGVSLPDGDFVTQDVGYMGTVGFQVGFSKYFSLGARGTVFQYNNGNQFEETLATVDVNLYADLLPNDKLAPFVYGGAGYGLGFGEQVIDDVEVEQEGFLKVQLGAGLRYNLSNSLALKVYAEQNINFSDKIDGVVAGKRNDWHYNFGLGLNYNINWNKKTTTDEILSDEN